MTEERKDAILVALALLRARSILDWMESDKPTIARNGSGGQSHSGGGFHSGTGRRTVAGVRSVKRTGRGIALHPLPCSGRTMRLNLIFPAMRLFWPKSMPSLPSLPWLQPA